MERLATLISLLFVLTAVQVQAQADEDQINALLETGCLEKANVTVEEVLGFTADDVEGNPRLQCYLSCYLEYYQLIRDCDLVFVGLENEEEEELREELYKTYEWCRLASQASEQCDCGFKWAKCINQVAPDSSVGYYNAPGE